MKQPSSTEAHIADLVQTKINSKVAIHTHICFMSMMEDWLDEMDPFVKWQDYSRADLMDIMEALLDLYEAKK